MEKIKEIRRINLIKLIDQYGQTELARLLGRTTTLLNSYKSENVKKNIGETFAEHIEKTLKLPENWMDKEHSSNQYYINEESQIFDTTSSLLQQRYNNSPKDIQTLITTLLDASETKSLDRRITESLLTLIEAAKNNGIKGEELQTSNNELYGKNN